MNAHKSYIDSPQGQIHVRTWGEQSNTSSNPLVCLHPVPYSGLFFKTIAAFLAQDRLVIAPDYPGYGGSDSLEGLPTIELYAAAMMAVLKETGDSECFDLMGFHTGCLVAVEMALSEPQSVGELVLVDVPYFDAKKSAELLEITTAKPEFTNDVNSLAKPWAMTFASRQSVQSDDEAVAMFAEQLRHGTRAAEGFHAAFTYNSAARFSLVDKSSLIMATKSSLHDPSIHAAAVLSHGSLLDCPQIKPPAFEQGAEAIADAAMGFLDSRNQEEPTD